MNKLDLNTNDPDIYTISRYTVYKGNYGYIYETHLDGDLQATTRLITRFLSDSDDSENKLK